MIADSSAPIGRPMAKGISSGYVPLGATAVTDAYQTMRLADAACRASAHGGTLLADEVALTDSEQA